METTKNDVKEAFAYARNLMREAQQIINNPYLTEFDNDSEIGQISNELVANASVLQMYLDEMQEIERLKKQMLVGFASENKS